MDSLEQLETAERAIEQIASEAKRQGFEGRPWHGPRKSRCYVRHRGFEVGHIEVERDGRPPATSLRVNYFCVDPSYGGFIESFAAQAEKLINDDQE